MFKIEGVTRPQLSFCFKRTGLEESFRQFIFFVTDGAWIESSCKGVAAWVWNLVGWEGNISVFNSGRHLLLLWRSGPGWWCYCGQLSRRWTVFVSKLIAQCLCKVWWIWVVLLQISGLLSLAFVPCVLILML